MCVVLELYKKDLHDPDNHDGMITYLEPDILECGLGMKSSWNEVKWALESITTNKASGGDGIPVELFQILKDDVVKVLPSIFLSIKVFSSESALCSGQGKEIEENNRVRKTRDLVKKIRDTKGTFHAKMGTIMTETVWT